MDVNKDELLTKTKEELKNEVSTISYETWIKPLEIYNIDRNHIIFSVQSEFQRDFIENRYSELILNTLKFVSNKEWTFSVIDLSKQQDLGPSVDSENQTLYKDDENDVVSNVSNAEIMTNRSDLNVKHTFENFVVGNNNGLAQAAALAIVDKTIDEYNPLFLYGGSGLGKTHLMHAIGNKIIEKNPKLNVLYVTSEKFTNQFINAIKDHKNDIFRNKYRNIDVLLIDDIQFIAGKERIQEEFFHTFNSLKENGKRIILSSDKPPMEIPSLETRLKSRFGWGLLADISCPDYETRLAILRKKAQEENTIIDDLILSNIASKIDSNIRDLEGVFHKITARASLTHSPITYELSEKIINEFKSANEKVISSEYIQEVVAKYFNIDKNSLASNKRSNDVTFPRQIAMYLCRNVANMSFKQIGDEFGKRDHSTVMHAYKKIEKEIQEKSNTRLIVESVQNIITKDEV